jgi:poly(3-hydroxybutyrate) depolymerase
MGIVVKNKPIILGIAILFLLLILNPLAHTKIIKNLDMDTGYIPGFQIKFLDNRIFFWKQPNSSTPELGYPVLFLFHGAAQHAFAWFAGLNQWSKYQTIFTEKALEQGYFIIAPESLRPVWPGPRAWDIFNNGSDSQDIIFIENIIEWLEKGDLPVDTNRLYCAGFSSGAFMCSHIGHYSRNRFSAIAVHSGANSDSVSLTNRGPYFNLNNSYNFSSFYPPTIIIHGETDVFVPVQCAKNFYSDLQKDDIPSSLLINPDEGHIWLSQYDPAILDWFKTSYY